MKRLLFALATAIFWAASGFVCAGAARIKSGALEIDFSGETGRLTRLALKGVWRKKLDVGGGFRVFTQAKGEREGKWIPFSAFKPIGRPARMRKTALVSSYEAAVGKGKIFVKTTAQPDRAGAVRLAIEIENAGAPPVLRVRYPVLDKVAFTPNGEKDELLWPFYSTILLKNPAENKEQIQNPLHYPRAVVNYVDLSGGGAGLTLIGDPSLVMNEFGFAPSAQKGAIDLRIDMINSILPGAKAKYEFILYLHRGDWREGADFYRQYFSRNFPRPKYPDWVKYGNGYLAKYYGSNFPPPYGKNIRLLINETWRLGLEHLQFWGQTGNHACPGYPLPDPLRGGEEGIARMFKRIRDAGIHTGAYFWSNGISKFVVLSSSFRGTPWKEFPKELRPPSWNWLVENSLYASPARKPPTKQLRSNSWKRAVRDYKVKTVKDAEEKKLVPQALHPCSFHSKAFRDWLRFWVGRYVENYHCDVPYLDVYGHRPKYVAYNPYLNKWGDGTEGQLRYAFLKNLIRDLRKIEKELVVFVEGAIDAYNVHAPALISNKRRFMAGYRYTHPDLILYEGMANGWWAYGKSNEAIANAYLDGNRFDLMFQMLRGDGERMVWMRDSLIRWIADGRYMGALGFEISSEKIQGCLFDAAGKLGSSLINFRNVERLEGETVRLDAGLAKKYARGFLVPLWGDVKFIGDPAKPIAIPATLVSSLLLVRSEPRAESVLPFVLPEMTPEGLRFDVRLINLADKKVHVKVRADFVDKALSLPVWETSVRARSVARKVFAVPRDAVGDRVERLRFFFERDVIKAKFRRAYTPVVEDPGFEWNGDLPLTTRRSSRGLSSLEVRPGTREKAYLKLAPKCRYKILLDVYKLAGSKADCFVWDSRQRKVIARFRGGSSIAVGEWGTIAAEFTSGEDTSLYITMRNRGTEPVYFDNIRVEAKK